DVQCARAEWRADERVAERAVVRPLVPGAVPAIGRERVSADSVGVTRSGEVQRQHDSERAAAARAGALGPDDPTVRRDDAAGDVQAEADTGGGARQPRVGAMEAVEDALHLARRYADTLVDHSHNGIRPTIDGADLTRDQDFAT